MNRMDELKKKILNGSKVSGFIYLRTFFSIEEYSTKDLKDFLDIFCTLNKIEFCEDEKSYIERI